MVAHACCRSVRAGCSPARACEGCWAHVTTAKASRKALSEWWMLASTG